MVTVKILGENYPIAASNDVAYISKVADYVDSRMRDVATRSRFQARDKVAILAAMSIASELLEKSEDVSQFEEQQSVGLDRLLARLDGAIDGDPSNAD
ncbi:MAG TPA: cell division protein ZapA [Acidobacteriota bacterium]|nr:cell division protein ZapA [Acidobacteriota bacterium]